MTNSTILVPQYLLLPLGAPQNISIGDFYILYILVIFYSLKIFVGEHSKDLGVTE